MDEKTPVVNAVKKTRRRESRFLSQIRALASTLSLRGLFGASVGYTFGGKRNVEQTLGYESDITLENYTHRYKRGGIAQRIVEAFPIDTWRGVNGELVEDETTVELTQFEEAWFDLSERLGAWSVFRRADILAGLGRYSVIFIGAPGELSSPLTRASAEQIMFLQPLGEQDALIKETEKDITNVRYGQPKVYELSIDNKRQRVDWTRMIHIAENPLSDPCFGTPRLEACWNYLNDLVKVVGGGSEAFWLRANQGLHLDIDDEAKVDDTEEEALEEEADEYQHGISRILRTRGVDVNTLGSDVADFKNNAGALIDLIAATSKVPQRILLGSERGQLASEQDRDNWADRVDDRRDQFAFPVVVRQFVTRMLDIGALPQVEWWEVRWPQRELSQGDKIANAKGMAEVNKAAGETVITPNEIRDRALELPPLEDVLDEDELEVGVAEDEDEDDLLSDEVDDELRAAYGGRAKKFKSKATTKRRKRKKLRVSKRDVWLAKKRHISIE